MIITTNTASRAHETNPTVTVVIPAYNAARYIAQALDSVQAQTVNDYEVIVVNDGSSDRAELERILNSHPLPVIYISQENKGVSAARNAAIKVARGTFYAQLDADDQWTPDYLEVQLGILNENPDVALVYPNALIIADESDAKVEFMKLSPSEGEVSFDSLVRGKCVVMTSVTARMSAIKQAGMYDEDIRSCEDFDLWLRVVKTGGRIIYHRQRLVLYRRHQGSLSSDRIWMTSNLLSVFEKCTITFDLTTAEAQVLKEQIAHHRAMLGLFEGKRALSAGGSSAALVHFERANEELRSPKLSLVVFFLRHAPFLVIWAFRARGRLLIKQAESLLTGIDSPPPAPASKPVGEANASEYTS